MFQDFNNCPVEQDNDAQFIATINKDGQFYAEFEWNNKFGDRWDADWLWSDLPEGEYDVEWNALMGGSNWHWNVNERMTIESEECTPNLQAGESWAELVNGETANIEVHIEVNNLNPDCTVEVEVLISVYLNNSYQFTMESNELGRYWVYEDAKIKIRDSRIDNLGIGDWSFETRFIPVGENEYCCQMTNTVTIEPDEPEEPPCNGTASFYNSSTEVRYGSNATDLLIWWDADWSCDATQQIEIDITLVHDNGTTFFAQTLAYNITATVGDVREWRIENLTGGHQYDLTMTIWVNVDGWRIDDTVAESISVS